MFLVFDSVAEIFLCTIIEYIDIRWNNLDHICVIFVTFSCKESYRSLIYVILSRFFTFLRRTRRSRFWKVAYLDLFLLDYFFFPCFLSRNTSLRSKQIDTMSRW